MINQIRSDIRAVSDFAKWWEPEVKKGVRSSQWRAGAIARLERAGIAGSLRWLVFCLYLLSRCRRCRKRI